MQWSLGAERGFVLSHSNEERGAKSREVTHFINCVGFSTCPLQKSVDVIKLPRTLGGGGKLQDGPVKRSVQSLI